MYGLSARVRSVRNRLSSSGTNSTNILKNLLSIVIFCEQRVILSQLLTFFIAISPGQPRTYLKANYFSLKCPNLFNVSQILLETCCNPLFRIARVRRTAVIFLQERLVVGVYSSLQSCTGRILGVHDQSLQTNSLTSSQAIKTNVQLN